MADSAFSPDTKTIFIIGAGVGKEAGLPVGSDVEVFAENLATRGRSHREDIQIRNDLTCNESFVEYTRTLSSPDPG